MQVDHTADVSSHDLYAMEIRLPIGRQLEIHAVIDHLALIEQRPHIACAQFNALGVCVVMGLPVVAHDGDQGVVKIGHAPKFRSFMARPRAAPLCGTARKVV